MRNTIVAFVLGLALVTAGIAYAGDEAPAAKPAVKTDTVAEAPAKEAATATPSPIHSMMKWVASHVMEGDGCGCPSTAEGEKAWRAWFKAENPKLATLRGQLMADGWTADKTVSFFKTMAAKKSCGSCDKSCDGCDKSKGAAAATGDAGKTGDAAGGCCKSKSKGCCGSCDKKADGAAAPTGDAGKTGDAAGGCSKSKGQGCCGGCDKKADGAAAPTGDAGKTGDAAGGCCKSKGKGCCGKDKKDCGGCDKKADGAAAPTGDAGKTGDASDKCPCTGKDQKDCSGCGKDTCPCGK